MTLTTMPRPATRTRDSAAVTMKAFVYQGPGKKALEERPKPEITAATDAIVKTIKTTICGTDLHILTSIAARRSSALTDELNSTSGISSAIIRFHHFLPYLASFGGDHRKRGKTITRQRTAALGAPRSLAAKAVRHDMSARLVADGRGFWGRAL